MSKIKIDTEKIAKELSEVIPGFTIKRTIEKETGISSRSFEHYKYDTPKIVELLYYNSKSTPIIEMIQEKSDLFPVLRLLKFYSDKTGNNIEDVLILKD